MKARLLVRVLLVLAAGSATVVAQGHVEAATPQLTFFSPPGGTSFAYGINNAGDIVVAWTAHRGAAGLAGRVVGGAFTALTGGGSAEDINDSRQVAGGSQVAGGLWRAVRWDGGTPTFLGTPAGANASLGLGINKAGQVAGYTQDADGTIRATRWDGAVPTTLLDFRGDANTVASDINNLGQVVGYTLTPTGTRATRWDGTIPTVLDDLPFAVQSYASAVNDSGQVVGYTQDRTTFLQRATRWDGTVPVELQTLGGFFSNALDINNAGQVVGQSAILGSSEVHAILWNGTVATDLDAFLGADDRRAGWVLPLAIGINDRGWIVGIASNRRLGETRAFVLSPGPLPAPVPEPSSLVLLSAGVLCLALSRNCRSSRS